MIRSKLWIVVAWVFLAGCPGSLRDPQRFADATAEGGSACGTPAEIEQQLVMRCGSSGCHGAMNPSQGLDLATANPASRLLGIASRCMGRPLVDRQNPSQGVLFEKLEASPTCGARMPLGAVAYSPGEIQCLQAWARMMTGSSDAATTSDATASDVSSGG